MPIPLPAQAPGHPLHVIQRSHCRMACFFCDQDRHAYLHWLAVYAEHSACSVHAYVLMGNHAHLLVTPSRPEGATRLMRSLGERYSRYVGEAHDHRGPLLEERCTAFTLGSSRHLLRCMGYIELNPVRARLVAAPGEYRWSSFRCNALGHSDALVTPHACYYALGRTAALRQAAYLASLRLAGLRRELAGAGPRPRQPRNGRQDRKKRD